MGPLAIVGIVLGILGVGILGSIAWNKWFASKEKIIPIADYIIMAAKFLVKQFEFAQQDIVLTILNYVQEAYKAIKNVSEITNIEDRVEAVLNKAYEICEREGLSLEENPEMVRLIEMTVNMIVTFWVDSAKKPETVDAKKIVK